MVPKSLTQGVAAVVALKVDGPAPGFDKPDRGRDGYDLAVLAEEEGGGQAKELMRVIHGKYCLYG